MINNNNAFIAHAWDIVRFHKPFIFIIFETEAEECRARQVTKLIGFDEFKVVPPYGLKGWDLVDVEEVHRFLELE